MNYDITSKLNFEEQPTITINGVKIGINADALTMLKLMELLERGETAETMREMYEVMFSENARNAIAEMKLSGTDWLKLITASMAIIQGEDPDKALDESGSKEDNTPIL